jgi:DNA-binding NtrC family response regulator
VFPIRVPPLRERREDIPELVRTFTARFAAEEGKAFLRGVAVDALDVLYRYDWPGNIRQLENAVFRAIVLADGPMLTVNEFPQIAAHQNGGREPLAADVPAPPTEPLEFDFPLAAAGRLEGGTLAAVDGEGEVRPLAEVEAAMIRLALERYQGRMSLIARRLGIGRSTLYRKLKELGISDTPQAFEAEVQ